MLLLLFCMRVRINKGFTLFIRFIYCIFFYTSQIYTSVALSNKIMTHSNIAQRLFSKLPCQRKNQSVYRNDAANGLRRKTCSTDFDWVGEAKAKVKLKKKKGRPNGSSKNFHLPTRRIWYLRCVHTRKATCARESERELMIEIEKIRERSDSIGSVVRLAG